MKGSISVNHIAKRNTGGGYTQLIPAGGCDICEGQSEGKGITHVVRFDIKCDLSVISIDVCKTCLCRALEEIDKRILHD